MVAGLAGGDAGRRCIGTRTDPQPRPARLFRRVVRHRTQPRPDAGGRARFDRTHDKCESPIRAEREVAARLAARRDATTRGRRRGSGVAVTVLRPTLLYGSEPRSQPDAPGRTSRAALALPAVAGERDRPAPAGARRRRARAPSSPASMSLQPHGRGFDLPGGEALPFDAMVARTLARQAPGVASDAAAARCMLSAWASGLADLAASRAGRQAAGACARRARTSLPRGTPAMRRAFGYAPRGFEPPLTCCDAANRVSIRRGIAS